MNTSSVFSNIRYQIISGIIMGIFYILIKHLGNEDVLYVQLKLPINYEMLLLQTLLSAIFLGVILGSIDSTIIEKVRKNKSFGYVVLIKILTYFTTFIFVLMLGYIFVFSLRGDQFGEILKNLPYVFGKRITWSILIYLAVTSFIISTIREINYKFGPGVFLKMLTGKYHQPKEEERIFMFLDLKSSTAIAEKLGHIMYSKLIQDSFYDINILLNKYDAEIYQYAGDEVIISWEKAKGIKNNNTLHYFFAVRNLIKKKNEIYLKKFGLVPEFKAGVNWGVVTVAEVGEIKREIAFHGDVLNTAARIQAMCNEMKSSFLISENFKNLIIDDSTFQIDFKGDIQLRGKETDTKLYSVEG